MDSVTIRQFVIANMRARLNGARADYANARFALSKANRGKGDKSAALAAMNRSRAKLQTTALELHQVLA